MKSISLVLLFSVVCGLLTAEDTWVPHVSLDENWRWTELERLSPYDIIIGAKGLDGDVWFAHKEGLLSFDGVEVKNYPINELKSERILDLTVLGSKYLVVTLSTSLIVWNQGQVSIIPSPENTIYVRKQVVQTSKGYLFVAIGTGIYQILGDRLIEIDIERGDITSILIDSNDKLWVSGAGGYSTKVYNLSDLAGQMMAELIHSFDSNEANSFGTILFMDSIKRVWVLDPDENDQCYLYDDYHRKPAIKGLREQALLLESLRIIETSRGEIWFCNSRKLARWNGGSLEIFSIEDFPIPSSYPYLIDLGDDRLLLGGQRLVPKIINLSQQRWTTYVGLNFQCEALDGGMWFLTKDRRVVRHERDFWEVFTQANGLIDRPNRIFISSDGTIWVSGAHQNKAAVAVYDGKDWQAYSFADAGKTFSHLAVMETTGGDIIFGAGTPENNLGNASGGAVVFRKIGSDYKATHYRPPAFLPRTANLVEREGDGLLASAGVIVKLRSNDVHIDEVNKWFSNQWIDHMIVDQDNDLWIAGLGAGVYQYDGNNWKMHNFSNGLTTKNVVYLLEYNPQGIMLALTDKGFYSYDSKNWGKWGFPINFPFRRENHTVYQTSDGAVWLNFTSRSWLLERRDFGQHNYEFQTIRYMPDGNPPQTHVSITNTRYPEGSQIQIQFDGADYWDDTSVHELTYSWSLDGNEWSAFSGDSSVTLTDVKAGDYQLHVRARDMDGNIDTTAATVSFRVIPPLWKQTWFILLLLVSVLLVVYLLYTLYRIRLKAALALDEFKLDFFTNISHELRNPLAVIMAPIEMLLEAGFDANTRGKLQIVLRNARKMQSMVDQLLQFRKIEKAQWSVNHEGGEIFGFTRESVMNHETLWQTKKQKLELDFGVESFLCNFDSSILQKVIDNLISNAIKYSEEKTTIRVVAGIKSIDGHEHYVLLVEDEGIGIPLHEQKLVLQPFYRIKSNSHQEGSGVGLALVNQLVSLWGGAIEIESPLFEHGKGTRVTVLLPLEPYNELVMADLGDPSDEQDKNGRPSLLFIEDNEDMRHILSDAFSEDYHVLESVDGLSGFNLALELNPDLIVSDVMMPGMDGYELCEKLKTNPETSHIPVILLTAKSSVEHRIEGIKSGADAYISKPLDMKHLKARIENLLESRRELRNKFARQLVVEATEITVTPTDELILTKAIKIVDDNMRDEHFDVERFGELMGMSRSTLKRKLKSVTGQSPQPFIQKLRLKRAAQLLTSSELSVSEVAAMVGFYDLSYFGKVFKKEFGKAPSQYAGNPS